MYKNFIHQSNRSLIFRKVVIFQHHTHSLMGNALSFLSNDLDTLFRNKPYITFRDLHSFTFLSTPCYRLKELPVYFLIDIDENGHFSRQSLDTFFDRVSSYNLFEEELVTQLERDALFHFAQHASSPGGLQLIGNWLGILLKGSYLKKPPYPLRSTEYVTIEAISVLYHLNVFFNITEHSSEICDLQSIIDLLQRNSELSGLLPLEDSSFDDLVPLPSIVSFGVNFASGVVKAFKSLKIDIIEDEEISKEVSNDEVDELSLSD
ncbi:hypothetical protein RCL1_002629 [Eukaryota sp. TZLM3-RCL]